MSNQTQYNNLNHKGIFKRLEEQLPPIGLLDLSRNSFKFFEANSTIFTSKNIDAIDMTENNLGVVNACDINVYSENSTKK